MIINLFDETEKALANHDVNFQKVQFICSRGGKISVANFTDQAKNLTYDNASGRIMVDPYIKIVGIAWWLERSVYNGVEGWVYCRRPKEPQITDYAWTPSNPDGLAARWWTTKIES